MAGKKLNLNDFKGKKHQLTIKDQKATKGGYKYVPSGAASTGLVDWTSIDIRNAERIGPPAESVNLIVFRKGL